MQCSRPSALLHHLVLIAVLTLSPLAGAMDAATTRQLEAVWRSAADLDGEAVTLAVGDESPLAIFRAHAAGTALGGVVLVHGPWTNADSIEVIRPLRLGLAEAGWDTLSIQLPGVRAHNAAADWQAMAPQIDAHLNAALDWLGQRERENRVIVALGESAAIALRFAATRPAEQLSAVVMISSPAKLDDQATRDALEKLARPVLDLYAQRDLRPVTDNAGRRAAAAQAAGLNGYTQRQITGALAGFAGLESMLLQVTRAWLRTNASR